MAPNAHALRVSRASGRGYHEVRIAVNLLVSRGVTNRAEAEQWVEEWVNEGVEDLTERAYEEIEEAVRSQ